MSLSSFFSEPLLAPTWYFTDLSNVNDRSRATSASDLLRQHSTASSNVFNGPRIDIHEENERFVVDAEVPGFKKEDLHIQVDDKGRKLTLSGTIRSEYHSEQGRTADSSNKKDGAASKDAPANGNKTVSTKDSNDSVIGNVRRPIVSERLFGSFSRSFTFPTHADLASIKANYADGVLKLFVPKLQKSADAPRTINIE